MARISTMLAIIRFPYLVSFLIVFLSLMGVYFGQNYFAIALVLVLHPLLDTLIGKRAPNTQGLSPSFFDRFLILTVVSIYAVWIYCFYFYLKAPSLSQAILIAVTCGLMMGFMGITTAHELVHRPEGLLKWGGFMTLWILNYGHWGVEHVFGHHKNVATPLDPVSARKNENIYFYLVRAIFGSLMHSFAFEKHKSFFQSKVRLSLSIQILMNLGIYAVWGVYGLIFHWIQSLIAVILLEGVEYIEHYGLERTKKENGIYEPVTEHHSWDCEHFLTNAALINLGYHSHHHQKPLVPYQDLPSKLGKRLMPFGYSTMLLIAFIPPVYFNLMNRRLNSN